MILAASLSVTPGSAFNSVAVAELRSIITALLAGAVVAGGEVGFGIVVAAGCANTGAAIVKARMPAGIRIYLNILISYFWRQVAVAAKNGLWVTLFLIGVVNFWYYREITRKFSRTVVGLIKFQAGSTTAPQSFSYLRRGGRALAVRRRCRGTLPSPASADRRGGGLRAGP